MLSLPHLIIVFLVALVVFGPEKLPELARNLGKFMGEFRRMSGEFKSTFETHMRELEREADERRRPAPTPPAVPAENSIRGTATDAASTEPSLPALKPAAGIVTAADPRVPVQDLSQVEGSNGANGDSFDVSASEESGDTPEPVTDGQHYPD